MAEGRGAYVAAFAASILAVAAAYASAFLPGGPPGWAPWAMSAGIAGALASVMALGATRDGSLGPLGPVFLFVFVVVAGGFGAALLLDGATDGGTGLWLGLPPPAAVVLYGVGLLPLVLVPAAYALTFERLTLGDEEWDEIRALGEAAEGARRPPPGGGDPGDDDRGDRRGDAAGRRAAVPPAAGEGADRGGAG